MAAARTFTIADFTTETRYEMRDISAKQWVPAEFTIYLNKCFEYIYFLLVDQESEILTIGTGTITTVAGTETYSLATNTMGDFWTPRKVDSNDEADAQRYWIWIATYDPMTMCYESERIPYAKAEEDSDTGMRDRPTKFYVQGDNIGFLPIPDDAYTVQVRYWPNYVPPTTNMPWRNLFNQEIKQAILMTAKNRQHYASPLDSVVQAMFADKAHSIRRKRRKKVLQLTPGVQFR